MACFNQPRRVWHVLCCTNVCAEQRVLQLLIFFSARAGVSRTKTTYSADNLFCRLGSLVLNTSLLVHAIKFNE